MTSSLPGLLGNLMFDYAALIGLADFYGFRPLLTLNNSFMREEGGARRVDDLSRRRIEAFARWFRLDIEDEVANSMPWRDYKKQKGWGRYDESLCMISNQTHVRVETSFSFKYFEGLGRGKLRGEVFVFPSTVREKGEAFLLDLRRKHQQIVGIHVRRGDKTWEFHMFDSWSHDAGYISRAVQTLRRVLRGAVAFLVVTDDPHWAQGAFRGFENVHFSPFHTSPACKVELVKQSAMYCEITISGSSTFSWWAAYLASDQTLTVAPRAPVNPDGPFGPCEQGGKEENRNVCASTNTSYISRVNYHVQCKEYSSHVALK
ncbi:hypothetical protein GUITHDRAFT_109466 [Guillardia theta CCMP2712]|uniref:L-Fucosyltransferase n=1 Tax=Guillardia theta (strain CCMP2712) TaxID=905079 RepID=L1J8M6_GUITC|nr:hypothetical protein GUITHDRAFT_109466 [Guillardia theta CCMP2712]EKX44687.1 hypothetical protein GUITHDRAFT_109466 [Guillardia theta CCMP2712]|eukprot:XP_005831667.1 hypothetical protein GUITHDRAFT_109466 [Guillardia theta CCMP2712]